jgi:iron complex transport system substrate-binding protein
MSDHFPQRIVCLTEEPTEVLYALGGRSTHRRHLRLHRAAAAGAQGKAESLGIHQREDRRDPEARARSGDRLFRHPGRYRARADQGGVEVWISNHRSVDGILAYIRRLGAMVGAHEKAEVYAQRAEQHIADIVRAAVAKLPRRPKVYFEEWDDPIITGIRWVAEIIGIAGGDDCFPELAREPLAKQRILPNGDEVIR